MGLPDQQAVLQARVMSHPPPPASRRDATVEVVHGHRIADPYRWLEDSGAAETTEWVAAQAAHSSDWLASLPARAEITEQLTRLWDRPTAGVPCERGGLWFQWRNAGLQGQPVLYVGSDPDDITRTLLDPNTLSADGTVAVVDTAVSRDGGLLAWSTSEGGSDWQSWRVREISTGRDRPDLIEQAKFGGASWLPAGNAFLYSAPEPPTPGEELVEDTRPMRLLLHRLGTAQAEDVVVFATPMEPMWFHDALVSHDGSWLIVSTTDGTDDEAALHVRRADDTGAFSSLIHDMSSTAAVVDTDGDTFYVVTDHLAERGRLVAVDLADSAREAWREVIPETDATLLSVTSAGGHFVCHYLRDAAAELAVHSRDGSFVRRLDVAPASTVLEISGRPTGRLVHWSTTSASDAGTLHRHDLTAGTTEVIRRTHLGLELAPVVNEQVFVTSADGTLVPVFLTRRADVTATGEVPTLIYGYGGFNHPMTPAFAPGWALWVERGGLLAVACLRGGGEYGRGWHDAGRLRHKENVFDDACAVAGWLEASGWSRPARIGLTGRSNGGLLVGACMTRQPERFGAFVPEVGVLDMLRFHLFTIGWAWKSDYGDPDVAADFEVLLRYSPLHNVKAGPLAPVLITTGDHDDRVVPAHSFKYAAALQAAVPPDSGPVLLRVDVAAGHGAGKPTGKSIAERADVLAFLEWALNPTEFHSPTEIHSPTESRQPRQRMPEGR